MANAAQMAQLAQLLTQTVAGNMEVRPNFLLRSLAALMLRP